MASRGCSIFGSGTSSQRMSLEPCQHSAFITHLAGVLARNGRNAHTAMPPVFGFLHCSLEPSTDTTPLLGTRSAASRIRRDGGNKESPGPIWLVADDQLSGRRP